jgi:pimeloyl-ACP methyl ester carboxylesterase
MTADGRYAGLPQLEGVKHLLIDVGPGVTIHVADAGPADGAPVMLVHGFPQNWWGWHELIGPLAADGYRVLCPDLRGAGWSSAPKDRYLKTDSRGFSRGAGSTGRRAGAARCTRLGGAPAFIMMLRYPQKVTGFFGVNNTIAPWWKFDAEFVRHLWRLWYLVPIALPVIGPRVIGDSKGRYLRMLLRWVGAGFSPAEDDFWLYVRRMVEPGHAVAGSRWYRTFQNREGLAWLRGEFDLARVDVPVRWLLGTGDPVVTTATVRGLDQRIGDFQLEKVDGVGHWFVEQRPDLVLDRLRAFLATT